MDIYGVFQSEDDYEGWDGLLEDHIFTSKEEADKCVEYLRSEAKERNDNYRDWHNGEDELEYSVQKLDIKTKFIIYYEYEMCISFKDCYSNGYCRLNTRTVFTKGNNVEDEIIIIPATNPKSSSIDIKLFTRNKYNISDVYYDKCKDIEKKIIKEEITKEDAINECINTINNIILDNKKRF